jgi:hypothetical protein
MWTAPDDAPRFEQLTDTLSNLLREQVAQHADRRVQPEDLAVYLEWLELAREGALCVRPFIDKSSPYALATLSYSDMESDFRWLRDQMEYTAA